MIYNMFPGMDLYYRSCTSHNGRLGYNDLDRIYLICLICLSDV